MESESDPLTRRPVDLFGKEPLKGKWEVHLHTPSKFGEDPSKDLGGDREQTHKHTNKRCLNYSMIMPFHIQNIMTVALMSVIHRNLSNMHLSFHQGLKAQMNIAFHCATTTIFVLANMMEWLGLSAVTDHHQNPGIRIPPSSLILRGFCRAHTSTSTLLRIMCIYKRLCT